MDVIKQVQEFNVPKNQTGGASDLEKAALAVFKLVKYFNCVKLLNSSKGTSIFSRKTPSATFNELKLDASRTILGKLTDIDQSNFLNEKVNIG